VAEPRNVATLCGHGGRDPVAAPAPSRRCAQRLYTAAWSCDSLAPTVTGFVADLRSGYSTYDMPPEELRAATFAAGELAAIAALNGWSIAEALERVFVRDQLFHIHEAHP
jgi:hypothetical protein